MFNLAIDSKLRASDPARLEFDDAAPRGQTAGRDDKKTETPVKFELADRPGKRSRPISRPLIASPATIYFGAAAGDIT